MTPTDLLHEPLGERPEFHLSKWQKRQATLLYHFASLDYLKGLKKLLDDFVNGVDITLDLAMRQGRDAAIANAQWGVRDTPSNFGSFEFPALKDFQRSINKQVAGVASEYYHATGYNQCSRLLDETSFGWTTPDEHDHFDKGMDVIGKYASDLDSTMQHRWGDNSMTLAWQELASRLSPQPKYRVRTDVAAESGKLPVHTGVYVPQDDPLGTLQFAWTGNSDGRLSDCKTFNDLGLQAFRTVGRDGMHTAHPALVPIANQPQYRADFKRLDWDKDPDFLGNPLNARRLIAREGYRSRPCMWYFVEKVEDEFDAERHPTQDKAAVPAMRLRCESGELCPRAGWWYSPAREKCSRRFESGEVMPDVGGDYGATIWQWDDNQP